MRRLIPAKQAKALEKLNENIVISDDGSMKIENIVVVDSIEQLGYIGESDVPFAGHLDYASQNPPIADDVTVATNVTSVVVTVGVANECPTDIPFLIKNGIVTNSGAIYWWIGDKAYYVSDNAGCELDVVGDCIVDEDTESNWSNLQYGEQFKPFFTEEQYEALLALIENE